MEAATKNRRGRPARDIYKHRLELSILNNDPLSPRAVQNDVHRENIECLLMELDRYDIQSFFLDSNGCTRRKGILEQVGRMADAGLFSADNDILIMLELCIKAYNMGLSCKDIEKRLRRLRLEKKRIDPNQLQIG